MKVSSWGNSLDIRIKITSNCIMMWKTKHEPQSKCVWSRALLTGVIILNRIRLGNSMRHNRLIIYLGFLSIKFLSWFMQEMVGSSQAFSQGPERGRPILVQRYIYTVKRGGRGGGGSRKRSSGKPLKFVTSCQYLFQARSKFFKHTLLCEFVPLCFFT
jgi:hypothetical protein